MRWGKIVLIFQAIVTIFLSVAFFTQILSLDNSEISELKIELSQGHLFWDTDAPKVMVDLKQRYTLAAYILFIVGTFEILIISRLIS